MCTVKGVMIKCACKDKRCRDRRDFVDRDAQGNVVRHSGHGWHYLKDELGSNICETGRKMLEDGEMKFVKEASKIVERVVPHPGVTVEWEVRTSTTHRPGVICDECRQQNHEVT